MHAKVKGSKINSLVWIVNYIIIYHFISYIGVHKRLGITSVEKVFRVKTLHKHSGYTTEKKHDIAVLELKGSVKISDKISTVCLPTEAPKPGTKCYITGLKTIQLC